MILSILIASLGSRSRQRGELLDELLRQIDSLSGTGQVQVLCEIDDGELSIGEKRNKLVARASGDYVCFIDDDDHVAGSYIRHLLKACEPGDADCVGFLGRIWYQGRWSTFEHSRKHEDMECVDGKFLRPPNHLNPIKRSIALQFPFPDSSMGEDAAYCLCMARDGVLKRERFIDETLYFYTPHHEPVPADKPWEEA
jgi:glycosyltransferase involved in cell wall biosynthesis